MRNKYYRRSRLSEKKFRRIVECFIEKMNITETSKKLHLEPKSVASIFLKIRERISEHCRNQTNALLEKVINDRKNPLTIIFRQIDRQNISRNLGVVAVLFKNGVVATNVLDMPPKPDSNNMRYKVVNIFNEEIFDYGFSNFRFRRMPGFFHSKKIDYNHFDQSISKFWIFAMVSTPRSITDKNEKFNLHLKETEWRFNNLPKSHIAPNAPQKMLYLPLLELLRNNPI